jgi:putative intracellular protease/amidase/Cu/Ag efflux protein CusF
MIKTSRLLRVVLSVMSMLCLSLFRAGAEDSGHAEAPAVSASPYTEEHPLVVGVLLFDGFEPLDVFGPVEVFGAVGKRIKIVTLAEKKEPSRPRFGPAVSVDRTLDDAESLDLLLVPGGSGTRTEVENAHLLAAIKRIADSTPQVASVCTGSGLLARAGLLSGLKATSNKRAFQWAVAQDRSVHWIHEARWVEDGKFFTSSGVSAGIDLSLGIVAKLFGRAVAVSAAQNIEYVWNDDPAKDPFAALNAYTARNDANIKFPLRGVVVDVFLSRGSVLVKHEDIPGIMAAMTMSFKVDAETLATVKKGDAIAASLFQLDGDWHLTDVKPAGARP